MKTAFYTLTFLILLTGCINQNTPSLNLDQVRENVAKETELSNSKTLAWEKQVTDLYKIADTNQAFTIKVIDNLISKDTSLDKNKISELHFIKGDIYYQIDSFKKAVDEFSTSGKSLDMNSPRDLAARAGAYIKLKKFDNAYNDLLKAAEINYDYYWNVGNYYEIIGKKDSAIACYHRLYLNDTIIYKHCLDRITELKNPKTTPMTELIFTDRGRKVLLWKVAK